MPVSSPAACRPAGTGLHWLGSDLLSRGFERGTGAAHILLTHLHWGHIQGMPFSAPLLVPGNHISFYGATTAGRPLQELLSLQMDSIYCPVPNALGEDVGAAAAVREIEPGSFRIGGWQVTGTRVNHAGVCLGFRVQRGACVLAYLPDVEYRRRADWRPALELADGADLLIHDAHFTAATATAPTATRRAWPARPAREGARYSVDAGRLARDSAPP